MRRELNLLYVAFSYFSRLPIPSTIEYSEKIQRNSFRYFPLVGIVVGFIGAITFIGFSFFLPSLASILFAIIAIMIATGGLHEDGFADFFDGMGGGRNREQVLAIMKDSHIGTYGVISLILLLLVKTTLLFYINAQNIPLLIIASCSYGRLLPILLINTSQYARSEQSKADFTRKKIHRRSLIIALCIGSAPLLCFSIKFIAILLLSSTLLLLLFRYYIHRRIGGFTGDTLGALEQFTEILFLTIFIGL